MLFRSLFLLLFAAPLAGQTAFSLSSPNEALRISIETVPGLAWRLDLHDQTLLLPASIDLQLEGFGIDKSGLSGTPRAETRSVRETLRPQVQQKSASIEERYNELTLTFNGNRGIIFRAYDEGVAYRFFTRYPAGDPLRVLRETYSVRLADAETVFFPEEESFYSHNERQSVRYSPAQLNESKLASLPTLLSNRSGVKVLLTETDLQDYPGLWLRGAQGGSLQGVFPNYPKYTLQTSDRDIKVTDREPFLARTGRQRQYPWRLVLVAEHDTDLLYNQMPWLLAEPSRLADATWVKPGKVAWDWWNALNLAGVNFRTGINTATYKYFVDFAAENGLEYIVLDEGWTDPGNLLAIHPDLDMDELAAYARSKSVGLILWVTWVSIDAQLEALLPNLKKWGAKGLKIDFMQRDDQPAVNFYWRMAEKAAAHQLLLDFHGAHKPAGLQRTWPQVLSFEGVYGLENSKWDTGKRIDPEHNVTLPFIRNVAGPMDYTPGAMLNYQRADWWPAFNRPASLGTRCHELAKYVVFESPLQMLSDSPTNYRKEPECLRFLSAVPATWARTVPLEGRVGDYVAVARQAANGHWYIGAMTDWTARPLSLPLGFLPPGDYEIDSYEDGLNADRNAQDYRHAVRRVNSTDTLRLQLAPGGGYVAVLRKL
ncbi:MAG: glycoside hydrolase family 97 protein [Saprospiraceae bacterium]|nr:glycoside hydrolase family 97 protein [Saprospiraceae bacterium]